jgi:serine/threonine-protein kinase HipA
LLERFAVSHLSLPISTVSNIIEKTSQSVSETRSLIPGYMNDHPEFEEIGGRMLAAWDEGLNGLMK